jgi:hypothetical protein
MLQLSLRIYISANLTIYLFVASSFFPEGLGLGLVAVCFSALFSAPTVLLPFAGFTLLQRLKPSLVASWLLLLPMICICAVIPQLLLSLWESGKMHIDKELFILCIGSAFTGTLLQSFYLHRYFKSL